MRLLIRPGPLPVESFSGYLLRLAEANGIRAHYLTQSLTGVATYDRRSVLDPSPLADMVGLEREQLALLSEVPEAGGARYRRVRGVDLPRSEVSWARARVCPLCLKGHSICESFWELTQAACCPIHGVMLVDTCTGCGKPLKWNRRHVAKCDCGTDLTAIATVHASGALRGLMGALRYCVYHDDQICAFPEGMEHLRHLGLARLCKLLWVMSSELRRRASDDPLPKSRSQYVAELERVAVALSDWPCEFRGWLDKTYEPLVRDQVPQPSFAWTFRWLFTRLLSRCAAGETIADNRKAFAFLVKEARGFGRSYWPDQALGTDTSSAPSGPLAARWGTRKQAAELLGVRLPTLNKLIEAGRISTRRVSASNRRPVLVDLEALEASAMSGHTRIVEFRYAARQLGVSIATLKEIRRRDLCGLTRPLTRAGSLSSSEVDALAARLLATAAGKPAVCVDGVEGVTSALMAAGASPEEGALFLDRLLTAPDLVVGCAKHAVGVSRLQVWGKDVKAFVADQRRDCAFMSNGEAAARLQCPPAVIQALVQNGLLLRGLCRGRQYPTVESVQQFAKEYEGAAKIARRLGMRSRWLLSHPNLPPVEQLNVRSSQYVATFFHRADVGRIEMAIRQAVKTPGRAPEPVASGGRH